MDDTRYVPLQEGLKILDLDRQSFFYYVNARRVKKQHVPGSRQKYTYAVDDLLAIKAQIHQRRSVRKPPTRRDPLQQEVPATGIATAEDIPYVYACMCDVVGMDAALPPDLLHCWWQACPSCMHLLFDDSNRRDIWGYLILLPVDEPALLSCLQRDLVALPPDMFVPYEAGRTYTCFLPSYAIRPEKRWMGTRFLRSILTSWCQRRDRTLEKIVTIVSSGETASDGLRLLKKLYFSPRSDMDGRVWELHLSWYNPSRIVTAYQQCLREQCPPLEKIP